MSSMYGKRQKREKTRRDKYGNLLRDNLSKTFKPPMSRRALPGAEIGTEDDGYKAAHNPNTCLLYTSPSPRDGLLSRMPSSA